MTNTLPTPAKKVTVTYYSPEGSYDHPSYLEATVSNEDIIEMITSQFEVEDIKFDGIVEDISTILGEGFVAMGIEYHSEEDYIAYMNDVYADVCPGGQGYDR